MWNGKTVDQLYHDALAYYQSNPDKLTTANKQNLINVAKQLGYITDSTNTPNGGTVNTVTNNSVANTTANNNSTIVGNNAAVIWNGNISNTAARSVNTTGINPVNGGNWNYPIATAGGTTVKTFTWVDTAPSLTRTRQNPNKYIFSL